MKKDKGTYYKALLLLIVFSMNTVVSFACSFSTMFHQSHHHDTTVLKDQHHEGGASHEHQHAGQHRHDAAKSEKKDAKDCCSESVVAIEKIEKSVSRTIEAPNVLFLTSFLAVYSDLFNIYSTLTKVVVPHYDRWRVPTTIQDLRIVIQSFQI